MYTFAHTIRIHTHTRTRTHNDRMRKCAQCANDFTKKTIQNTVKQMASCVAASVFVRYMTCIRFLY